MEFSLRLIAGFWMTRRRVRGRIGIWQAWIAREGDGEDGALGQGKRGRAGVRGGGIELGEWPEGDTGNSRA